MEIREQKIERKQEEIRELKYLKMDYERNIKDCEALIKKAEQRSWRRKIIREIYFKIWYWFAEFFYCPYGERILKSRAKRKEFQRKYDIY